MTSQMENLATESFLYLLRSYREAHKAFVELVATIGYVPPSGLRFDTQVHMQQGSISDLVGAAEDKTSVPRLRVRNIRFAATKSTGDSYSHWTCLPRRRARRSSKF
jgi:hypothetical protein